MKKVSFTEMKNGSKEDYLFLDKLEKEYASKKTRKVLLLNSRTTEFMNSGNGMSFREIFHYAQVVCLLDTIF